MSRTKDIAIKVIYAAMSVLRDNGKEMPMRDLLEQVEKRVVLDDWARGQYEKSGYVRWQSILHFYSIDCIKAGFLIKNRGIWYITPEGAEALKLGPEGLMSSAQIAYRTWRANQPVKDVAVEVSEPEIERETQEKYPIEQAAQLALAGFENHINAKNPYEFQDLVAALLRGMGYYTPFVAPRGKDGGVDIVAYRDPLGTQSPRIQVQIKHRDTPAKVEEIRQLMGLLQREGAVGIFVSSGGFTPDARTTARSSHAHVELIDLTRFIGLWQDFYDKLSDEDKGLMQIRPLYFVAPQD